MNLEQKPMNTEQKTDTREYKGRSRRRTAATRDRVNTLGSLVVRGSHETCIMMSLMRSYPPLFALAGFVPHGDWDARVEWRDIGLGTCIYIAMI